MGLAYWNQPGPRTCPMLTVNWEVLDGLGKDPRVGTYDKI